VAEAISFHRLVRTRTGIITVDWHRHCYDAASINTAL
jgi:hypothetical protein